ncbi:fluoride efflux transporter CrcB [Candidatus Chloroploca sp. M-50]|uniref:Fluoride-specific ion channel FluC n=1 Tax=Candidatus Chloroploca mongolica TaxID=2528176 RepID=A0ABS4DC45_9CHLR|nr:fluoride efflux transporter CrcB [Candidatus Chloroploca mongolica]MBP1467014.1 fluoride efflux transporter CrcB [Candidatus Chloroploca mongolica]
MKPFFNWPRSAGMLLPSTELAIALGAVLGASTRFTLTSLLAPLHPAGLPLGTLLVNVIGCFFIGAAQTLFLELISVRRQIQVLVTVGFLGGLTTFSSVSVELVRLIQAGALPTAAAYQFGSLVGGVVAALVGIVLARLLHRLVSARGRP